MAKQQDEWKFHIQQIFNRIFDDVGKFISVQQDPNSVSKTTVVNNEGGDVNTINNEDNYLSEFLLNAGTKDMAVDGTTPVEYSYTVPTGKVLKVARCFITMEDGAASFSPGNFGAIAGDLTNGVEVSVTSSGASKVVLELWHNNREVRNTMFDFDTQFKVAGAYIGRWTFSKDLANGGLILTAGDKISIIIQDNLSLLDHLSFRIKGTIRSV